MAAESSRTFLDDDESLHALVDLMPDGGEEYRGYGALKLESVFPQRRMIVYTLKNGQPTDVEMLVFGELTVDRVEGPTAEVQGPNAHFQITPIPTRYGNRDLYLHIPQHFAIKWKGKKGSDGRVNFLAHYAVLVKSQSKELHQEEGHTYCETLNHFWERFPHLKNIRY